VRFVTFVFCDIKLCGVEVKEESDVIAVFFGRDSNQTPPKYKSVAFSIKPFSRSHEV